MQILNRLKSKKVRYILYSLVLFILFIWADSVLQSGGSCVLPNTLLFLVAFTGTLFTQYSSLSDYKSFLVLILPLGLTLGVLLTLYFFPNFSLIFKLLGFFIVSILYYLINLVNNIFLVVEEKADIIPLYRVALTWSQILLIIVSIPLFAGIYKLNVSPLLQAGYVGLLSFSFTLYFFWNLWFDKRVRKISLVDLVINCLLCTFFVVSTGLAISFIPSESFLRALFSASILLFGLNYLDAYMKNRINSSLMYQYGVISLIFLIFILIFRP